MSLDPVALRADFPALDQTVNGKPLVYLDNAATSQKPRAVIDALVQYYEHDNANVHRGIHELSRRATVVVFTRGTTEAINLVAHGWGHALVKEGDEILLSVLEHHSNIVPWQLLAARTGAKLRYIELDEQGRMILEDLPTLITARTRIVAVSHVSNALGTINPIERIARAAKERGALVVIDGAQGAVHLPVDVQALGVDVYALSGHKMCGPTGIGAMWARKELLESLPPYHGGGEMIRIVERDQSTWADVPHKFEAGTPNIAGAIGLGAAVDYLSAIGHEALMAHEQDLTSYAIERLRGLDEIRIYGPDNAEERSGIVSFTLGDAHPHDIATILDSEGIAVRAGHHCAQLVMKRFGVSSTARASLYLYNTRDDVDRLLDAFDIVQGIFAR